MCAVYVGYFFLRIEKKILLQFADELGWSIWYSGVGLCGRERQHEGRKDYPEL